MVRLRRADRGRLLAVQAPRHWAPAKAKEEQLAPKKDQKTGEVKKATKEEQLRVLIDQVLAAHGGEDKLNKLQFTMTVKEGYTNQYFVQPPKNFRWEQQHRDQTGKMIVILFPDGRRWWTKEPNEDAKEFRPTGVEIRLTDPTGHTTAVEWLFVIVPVLALLGVATSLVVRGEAAEHRGLAAPLARAASELRRISGLPAWCIGDERDLTLGKVLALVGHGSLDRIPLAAKPIIRASREQGEPHEQGAQPRDPATIAVHLKELWPRFIDIHRPCLETDCPTVLA